MPQALLLKTSKDWETEAFEQVNPCANGPYHSITNRQFLT